MPVFQPTPTSSGCISRGLFRVATGISGPSTLVTAGRVGISEMVLEPTGTRDGRERGRAVIGPDGCLCGKWSLGMETVKASCIMVSSPAYSILNTIVRVTCTILFHCLHIHGTDDQCGGLLTDRVCKCIVVRADTFHACMDK